MEYVVGTYQIPIDNRYTTEHDGCTTYLGKEEISVYNKGKLPALIVPYYK